MTEIILAIIAALLPVGLLAYYIYWKDKDQPEPKKWLWKGGLYGVLSALLISVTGLFLPSFIGIFESLDGTVLGAIGTSLFDAAIPEEGVKLLVLWLLIRNNPYFDEKIDGIVYATMVGLGFAGLENIFYVLASLDSFASVAITRALFSVPGHFFFAVVMGYYVSLASFKNNSKSEKRKYWLLAFFVPMALHFVFDALLMSMDVVGELCGMLIIAFLIFCNWLRKTGIDRINALKLKDITAAPEPAVQTYVPKPLDTSDVQLSEELDELAESLAKNVHEVWSANRIAEGWTYGRVRDDVKKTHPCLIPYEDLPESEKDYDRSTSSETLKMIVSLGFEVRK